MMKGIDNIFVVLLLASTIGFSLVSLLSFSSNAPDNLSYGFMFLGTAIVSIILLRGVLKKSKQEIIYPEYYEREPIQSKTEIMLLEALEKYGLHPEPQYEIGRMHVDMAFPEHNVAIEVDGPHHEIDHQRLADQRRGFVIRKYGYSLWRFKADDVYEDADKVAKKIIKRLERRR